MNLYNPSLVPVGLRRCYWDADYIASQPFCVTSKLTETELEALAAYEEATFWLSIEQIKKGLSKQARFEVEEVLEELKEDGVMEAAEKALKKFGFCNTQTSGRVLPKTTIKRSDFLNR